MICFIHLTTIKLICGILDFLMSEAEQDTTRTLMHMESSIQLGHRALTCLVTICSPAGMFPCRELRFNSKTMNKRNIILRLACFIVVYLLFYAVPILVIRVAPLSVMTHLPAWVGNYCFIIPAWTFPFDKILSADGQDFIFNDVIGWLIMLIYLALLGFLFLKVTRPVRKLRWVIPLAFGFSALSIFLLNILFMACGVSVCINSP
jgi:hypothetical protein